MEPKALRRRIVRNIRRLAAEREMSLTEVAIKSGLAKSAFFRAIKLEGSMTTDSVCRIAKTLRVDPSEVLAPEPARKTG